MRRFSFAILLVSSLVLCGQISKSLPAPNAESGHLLESANSRLAEARSRAFAKDNAEPLAILDMIQRSYGNTHSPGLRKICLEALLEKARVLIKTDHPEEAINTSKTVFQQYGQDRNPQVHEQVLQWNTNIAQALCERSSSLDEYAPNGRPNLAYGSLLRHFSSTRDMGTARWVAAAMVDHAWGASIAGQAQEAARINQTVVDRFGSAKATEIFILVNNAILNQGGELRESGHSREAIAVYDRIFHRNQANGKNGLDEPTIQALRFKGITLTDLGRCEEAIPLFDEALSRMRSLAGKGNPVLESALFINKGYALAMLNQPKDSIGAYDELLRRFERSRDQSVVENVVLAMVNKGIEMDSKNQGEEACFLFDKVIARYSGSTAPSIREEVASAYVNKEVKLREMGRLEESLATYDALNAKMGEATEPRIRACLFKAINEKGSALFKLGRMEEAIAFARQSIEKHESDVMPEDRSDLVDSIGYWNLILAKKEWAEQGRTPEVDQRLQAALDGMRRNLVDCKNTRGKPYFLGNFSYALFLLGHASESESSMREALSTGDEALYLGELEDAGIQPCPMDEAFRAMVQRI